jgi:glycosyltransferase involved in cell wall biosynthesis
MPVGQSDLLGCDSAGEMPTAGQECAPVSASRRIASLTTFYPPYNFGGDGVDVQRTARALARRGHQVTVIHDLDAYRVLSGGANPTPVADPEVEVIGLESRLSRLSVLLTHQLGRPVVHAATLAALDRARRFDVVLLNNVSLVGGPGVFQFGRDAVRIYIAHEHWLVCPTHVLWRQNREACDGRKCLRCVVAYRRPPQLWRYTGALTRALRHVDAFVARSEFSRLKHKEFGFPRQMDVLPYVLPSPEEEAPLAPPPHASPYFLFAGRLEKIKGVDDLIRAFPRDLEADLLIAGDGQEAADLQGLAAGHPRIRFLGRVPAERLGAFYQHSLALVMPSRGFETFGMVVAEALSHGTPAIVRRIGPLPEFIRQTGGGETFTSQEELTGHLRRFASDPGWARALGERGRSQLGRQWGADVAINQLEAIIERELVRKGSQAMREAYNR